MGQNAIRDARMELRKPGTRLIGTVAYFPERYGDELIPLAVSILQKKPVPAAVFVKHQLITSRNVELIYPLDKQCEVKVGFVRDSAIRNFRFPVPLCLTLIDRVDGSSASPVQWLVDGGVRFWARWLYAPRGASSCKRSAAVLGSSLVGRSCGWLAGSSSSREVLREYPYGAVTLTGGPLQQQYDRIHASYLALDNDRLLKVYRQRAGLPSPGRDMGGWYDTDGFVPGHSLGQYISGLARIGATTSDPACAAKVRELVRGFAATLGTDNQSIIRPQTNLWICYTLDKHFGGLIDAYHACSRRRGARSTAAGARWLPIADAGTRPRSCRQEGSAV